jgi:putative transposase
MDFMHDRLSDGRSLRVLTVIDIATRECIALKAATRFQGSDVTEVLRGAKTERGALPQRIRVDNGTEFTSKALDHWASWNQIQLDFSRPGKPTDNAFIEAFNGTVRRECLSAHWFTSVADANRILSAWRDDYNNARPHSRLGGRHHRPRTGPVPQELLTESGSENHAASGPTMESGAPANLSSVGSCESRNRSFWKDDQYLAFMIEAARPAALVGCAPAGSSDCSRPAFSHFLRS